MTDTEIKPTPESPDGAVEKPTIPEKPEVQIETPEQLDTLRAEAKQGIADLARTDTEATLGRIERVTSSIGKGSEEGKTMAVRQASEIKAVEQTTLIKIEASKIGQSLSAIPTGEDFERVGTGAPVFDGSAEEQAASQNLLIRLETGQVGGKPATIETEAVSTEVEINFNPGAHAEQLREKVKGLLGRPEIDNFFSQLHQDDLKDLVGVLSRESMNPKLGRLADLLRSSVKSKDQFAQNAEKHTKEQIRQLFVQFKTDFDKVLDQVFSRAEILGMAELDIDAAMKRSNGLILSQRRILGPGPIQDFVDSLAYRALAEVRKEIEAQKKAQQSAEILEAVEAVEKREEPQEWLDQKREAAYAEFGKILSELEESGGVEGVQKWYADFFNPALTEAGLEPLKPEDVQSLRYLDVISESSSRIAGKEIRRPVLIFTNIGEYQRFSSRLQGEHGMSSRGMYLPRDIFAEGDLLRETGLLIATGNKEFIDHEVRHSIDPNLEARKGYDGILDEAFAYYQQDIVEGRSEAYRHLAKPEDGPWRRFAGSIGGEIYGETYSKGAEKKLSSDELAKLSQDVVAAIRSISEKSGHVETQRILAQTKSIEELLRLAK
ncbi:hypothetical protein HYV71_00335 [Candidatus Uhrbacteria bacterium]|nr:hypothetical protein [Candidatus Uhrbacteria bacterium]